MSQHSHPPLPFHSSSQYIDIITMKDYCTACCCLIFLGPCGGHRCYLDDVCCRVVYFLTFGFAGFGVLCDCCYLGTMVNAANLKYSGGGGGVNVVVQNNISNSNSNVMQAPQQQVYQPPQQYQPQPSPPYQQQAYQPPPQYQQQQQPGPQFMPPPQDWQQGRAKSGGGFCSSCGTAKDGRFCGKCGSE